MKKLSYYETAFSFLFQNVIYQSSNKVTIELRIFRRYR